MSSYTATNWQDVVSYGGVNLYHTVSVSTDSLLANEKYRFRIKAINAYGSSDWSPTIDLVVAALPSAPVAPTKNQLLSSQTSIYVEWDDPVTDTEIITGF